MLCPLWAMADGRRGSRWWRRAESSETLGALSGGAVCGVGKVKGGKA